jgi:hypothetical protein
MNWKEELEDLKCVNGAMYFGSEEDPCRGGCCPNEQTYGEAKQELEQFIEKQIRLAVEETYKEIRPEEKKNASVSEYYSGYNQALEDLDENYQKFISEK